MQKPLDEKLNGFLFVVILPFLLFFISYYGFESSYVKLKSMEEAPDFMFSSVYAYRIIPNFLMVHVSSVLDFFLTYFPGSFTGFLLKNGTVFYHSIFLINVTFFLLSSWVLNAILNFKTSLFFSDINVKRMVHLLAVFFIVIVQYVPTNCDCIAVFFYLLGVLFTLKYDHDRKFAHFILLFITVFISTLVRETSCLNIAFFASVFIDFEKLKNKNFDFLKDLGFLILAFAVPYLGLKIMIPQNASFFEGVYVLKNFTSPFNLMGLLFGMVGFYFIYNLCDSLGKTILRKYLFFSLPYLGMITFVGLFWETRLFLPLILSGIVVASHPFKNFSILK